MNAASDNQCCAACRKGNRAKYDACDPDTGCNALKAFLICVSADAVNAQARRSAEQIRQLNAQREELRD